MKITSVELHPDGSDFVAVLSFRDPTRQNPYNVRSIAGLDADQIVPRYYGKATNSEKKFYSLTPLKREPVMRIELNPSFGEGKSYSDLRDDLYRLIASSRTGMVRIEFKNGPATVAAIYGLVTKSEATLFEKNPEVQLTFSVEDSMLKPLEPTFMPIFVGINLNDVNIQDDLSTAPHGLNFQLHFTGASPALTITDPTDASWSFVVTPLGGFLNGDILTFSSEPTNKKLYITRGAATIYLADRITPGSMWPILFHGANHFKFAPVASIVLDEISYYPTYWGV